MQFGRDMSDKYWRWITRYNKEVVSYQVTRKGTEKRSVALSMLPIMAYHRDRKRMSFTGVNRK